MDQEADAAHGVAGHDADLLVAELLLEPEPQRFLLRRGKRADRGQQAARVVALLQARLRVSARLFQGRGSVVVERLQWTLLLPDVEGAVPADAEEPGRKVIADTVQVLAAEAEER